MIYRGKNNEYLQLETIKEARSILLDRELSYPLVFIWTQDNKTEIEFEGVKIRLKANTVLCLTQFYKLEILNLDTARFIKFNREFYCVLDHDREVSCKGILFYGANQLPLFQIQEDETEKFESLWKMFEIEMQSKDELQLEMLQVMLKRFIILCTRTFKSRNNYSDLKLKEVDIVREYNFLVEQYFKTKHTVGDYAEMLNKSPKTLSNLFARVSTQTPLQIIHERKMLEARRMLRYTDKSVKEIAYDLGFEDIHAFSRFFKKLEKRSPSEFKNSLMGNIANS